MAEQPITAGSSPRDLSAHVTLQGAKQHFLKFPCGLLFCWTPLPLEAARDEGGGSRGAANYGDAILRAAPPTSVQLRIKMTQD